MKKWAIKTGIKVAKTMAETGLAVIIYYVGGTGIDKGFNEAFQLQTVDWKVFVSATILSGIITVLFNIKSFKK